MKIGEHPDVSAELKRPSLANLKYKRQLCILFLAFLLLQLPSLLWFFSIVVFFAILILTEKKDYPFFMVCAIICVLALLRFMAYSKIVEGGGAIPPPFVQPEQALSSSLLIRVFGKSDVNQLEHFTRNRMLLIIKGESQIDPFTGGPYLVRDDVYYSVGPNQIDDKLEIIYDPTNGTFSRGDIIFNSSPEVNP